MHCAGVAIRTLPEFLLEDLKSLCEHSARKIVSVANVAKMLLAAESYQGETLKAACLTFVQKNMPEVRYAAYARESCFSAGEPGRLKEHSFLF